MYTIFGTPCTRAFQVIPSVSISKSGSLWGLPVTSFLTNKIWLLHYEEFKRERVQRDSLKVIPVLGGGLESKRLEDVL